MMQEKNSNIVINFLIDRLKSHYQLDTDVQLAYKLGVKPNTLSMWRSRNAIDFNLIFKLCDDLDFHWLITGEHYSGNESNAINGPCKLCSEKDQTINALKEANSALHLAIDKMSSQEKGKVDYKQTG